MIVFLIGLPACGKTSLGKRLAKEMQFNFIDLDNYLSLKEGKIISTIFKEQGEQFFRELETRYLKEISQTTENTVISVGGGTPCFHNNMEFMLSAGKVFYLNTPIETLQLRLTEDTQRPFFSGLSEQEIKAKLISLFEEREKIYLKAYKKINTAHKSDKAIMEEISHEINM